MSIFTPALIAATLLASATISTAAMASDVAFNDRGERVATISYGDLDLNSPKGQKALNARLVRAARSVCGAEYEDVRDLAQSMEIRDCFQTAMAKFNSSGHGTQVARADKTGH